MRLRMELLRVSLMYTCAIEGILTVHKFPRNENGP